MEYILQFVFLVGGLILVMYLFCNNSSFTGKGYSWFFFNLIFLLSDLYSNNKGTEKVFSMNPYNHIFFLFFKILILNHSILRHDFQTKVIYNCILIMRWLYCYLCLTLHIGLYMNLKDRMKCSNIFKI